MRKKIGAIVASLLVTVGAASATTVPWTREDQAHTDQLHEMEPRITARFLLGLHGELFWIEDFHEEYLRDSRCYAVKNEGGSGLELLVEQGRMFISYATISADAKVTYGDTPEARALTANGFCGVREWPEKELASKAPDHGKVKVFADGAEATFPRRPKGCEGVAYALTDGAFYFCQPNEVYSPYPLWLMRVDDRHMRLVSTDSSDGILVDITGSSHSYDLTIYRDSRMNDLNPPYAGLYNLHKKCEQVSTPAELLYVCRWNVNGEGNVRRNELIVNPKAVGHKVSLKMPIIMKP